MRVIENAHDGDRNAYTDRPKDLVGRGYTEIAVSNESNRVSALAADLKIQV
jgi:hypothetical protein